MLSVDVAVAGGGVAGLLIASELAPDHSVLVLEQADDLPRNKYWLTDDKAMLAAQDLGACVDRRYDSLDFVASDRISARLTGKFCLWDTDQLVSELSLRLSRRNVRILTGHRLYSITQERTGVLVRANSETIKARLLIDCMGFGSPLVGTSNAVKMLGYYVLHGCEVALRRDIAPIALDNVVNGRYPAFFELFPTSRGTAHAALILPSRNHRPDRSIKGELNFILSKSHYSHDLIVDPKARSYFGIIPVGRLRQTAADRIVFFGEAGQANPAASATGLSRMLQSYRQLAVAIARCLQNDLLHQNDLVKALPDYMTRMNRVFQESVFESLLSFDSNDFRRLVFDLRELGDQTVNDLVFADFDFLGPRALRLAFQALLRPRRVVGSHFLRSVLRYGVPRRLL